MLLFLVGTGKINISNKNLQSLFLSTCRINTIEEEKENYKITLREINDLQTYISSKECSGANSNSSMWITCKWLQEELENKKNAQKKYEECYWELEKQGQIKKEIQNDNNSKNKPPFNSRQFIDPVFTCAAPRNYQSVTSFNDSINPSIISWTVIGKSFDGGWYQKVKLSTWNQTVIKRKINSNKQIEIDNSFIFLSGSIGNVGDIIGVQEYGDGSIYVVYEDMHHQNLILVQTDRTGNMVGKAVNIETKISNKFAIYDDFNRQPIFFTQDKRMLVLWDNSKNDNHELILYFFDLQTNQKKSINRQNIFQWHIIIAWQQSDGKIIYQEWTNLKRINPDGTPDTSFQSPEYSFNQTVSTKCPSTWNIKVFPDNSIIVSGNFTEINKTTRKCIARLLPDGNIDPDFNPEEWFTMIWSLLFIDYDWQNNIIARGQFDWYRWVKQKNFIVINKNGDVNKNISYGIRTSDLETIGNSSNVITSANNSILLSWWLFAIIGQNISGDGSCNEENQINSSTNTLNATCNRDDFEKGVYIHNKKVYIPSQNDINIYDLEDLQLIKKIQRWSSFIPSWGLNYQLMNAGVKIGKYLYIGSQLGMDIIDMETDTWIKTLGHHKPDESSSTQGALPADTLTTFQYNNETYVIRSDHIIYRVEGTKPMTLDEKYVTFTPTSGWSIPNDLSVTESISSMGQIGDKIYAIGRSRLLVIDPQTQKVIQEVKYDVAPYKGLSFNKEQESFYSGPLITNVNKLYIPTSRWFEIGEKAKSARWIVIDTNTLKVANILENPPESDPHNDKLDKSICPAVPLSPRSIFIDKEKIYMSFIDQPQLSRWEINNCDIMVLDTKNDTFSSIEEVSDNILYQLQLAKNGISLSRIGFEYGKWYTIPKDWENYYNVYDKTSSYRKINTIGWPVLSWWQPISQKEWKIYYSIQSGSLQMLDLNQAGTCSAN